GFQEPDTHCANIECADAVGLDPMWVWMSVRWIHARPENTCIAQRQRLRARPAKTGALGVAESEERSRGHRKRCSDFIPSPTQVPGPAVSAKLRANLQWSRGVSELLSHLSRALRATSMDGHVDRHVFGAALRRCEQGRWWDGVQEVRRLQVAHGVEMDEVGLGIYLTALARCGRTAADTPVTQKKLLADARRAWEEFTGHFATLDQGRILLNSALHVCSVSTTCAGEEALGWAEELWSWAFKHGIQPNQVNYETFLTVLSKCGKHERVDEMLRQMEDHARCPSPVLLAALVHVAGEQRNAERAEALWQRMLEMGTVPNVLALAARAKAHLLSGNVKACAEILESADTAALVANYKMSEMLVQARAVIYHASLATPDQASLEMALESTAAVGEMSHSQGEVQTAALLGDFR
ncbi:unnamed protein product, partial [Durusdinium trenchii]